jgi:hypothetical protein
MEINVIPESEAPIIPKATKNHGDFLLAKKNVSLFAPRLVTYEIPIKRRK